MGLLLDTVALVRGFAEPERLPVSLAQALRASGASGDVYVSVVSIWEIALKSAIGKLKVPDDLPQRLKAHADFTMLAISPVHVWRTRTLPMFADHKDPFDRLLVAQAWKKTCRWRRPTRTSRAMALRLYGEGRRRKARR